MTNYSIVIRTLGTGRGKYQRLLDSIKSQTIQPKHIFVFPYFLPYNIKNTNNYEKQKNIPNHN